MIGGFFVNAALVGVVSLVSGSVRSIRSRGIVEVVRERKICVGVMKKLKEWK